jgi:hypothetical protein
MKENKEDEKKIEERVETSEKKFLEKGGTIEEDS